MHRNIVWDLDGTLFNTYPAMTAGFVGAMKDNGKDVDPARVLSLAQVSFDHCVATLSKSSGLSTSSIEKGFDQNYARVTYLAQPPFRGARRLCEYICGIGGRNVIVTHRRQESTVGLLETHGMKELFAGWITASDGYAKKPSPQAFEAALRVYGLERSETIGLGDRDIDSMAARAAGLFTCRFGSVPGSDVPDLAVTSHEQLMEYLSKENGAQGE